MMALTRGLTHLSPHRKQRHLKYPVVTRVSLGSLHTDLQSQKSGVQSVDFMVSSEGEKLQECDCGIAA